MIDRVRYKEIVVPNDPLMRSAYALLRRIFPRKELVPLRELQNALRERAAGVLADLRWHIFVAYRAKRVVGVASGTYLGSINIGIVGYLAVDAAERARGLGPRLRRRLRAAFERDAHQLREEQLAAIVGEVEEDNPWLGRLVRRGALVLDFPYVQPALRPNARTVPLALYFEPLDGRTRHVPASLVKQLVFALWRRGYRIAKPLNDPRFRAMLRKLEKRSRIGGRTPRAARPRPSVRE